VENKVVLTAVIVEIEALRFTPSGLPAISIWLEHSSKQSEAGLEREVNASLKAVAFGSIAEQLSRIDLHNL
jgi:primosomal replication protein N